MIDTAAPVSTRNRNFPMPTTLAGATQHPVLDIVEIRTLSFSKFSERAGPEGRESECGPALPSFPPAGEDAETVYSPYSAAYLDKDN